MFKIAPQSCRGTKIRRPKSDSAMKSTHRSSIASPLASASAHPINFVMASASNLCPSTMLCPFGVVAFFTFEAGTGSFGQDNAAQRTCELIQKAGPYKQQLSKLNNSYNESTSEIFITLAAI